MEKLYGYKPSCCNRIYLQKRSAIRHEKSCFKNPNNKACITCNNFHDGDNRICDFGRNLDFNLEHDCIGWKMKQLKKTKL